MELKCVAIDDEPLALELIADYCSRIPRLKLVQVFEDAISGAEYLRKVKIDLLFIDVNMPDITGIDLVRSLATKPQIIFTTAHKKFAFEGFEMEAIDYLLKPIAFDRFSRAVYKAIDRFDSSSTKKKKEDQHILIRSEYKLVNVSLQDIIFIESLEDYVRLHLTDQKAILSLMTMKAIMEKLPQDDFRRIHRKYIISLAQIRSVVNRKVSLKSGVELPVSDSYADFLNSPQRDS